MKNNKMALKFSIATNENGLLEEKPFGEADKFLMYELNGDELEFIGEEMNDIKLDYGDSFSLEEHGTHIIDFLIKKGVNILVSLHFGDHVKGANEFFIPVIVYHKDPVEVVKSIKEHLYWIIDEWEKSPSDFSLFMIKKGMLKSHLKN